MHLFIGRYATANVFCLIDTYNLPESQSGHDSNCSLLIRCLPLDPLLYYHYSLADQSISPHISVSTNISITDTTLPEKQNLAQNNEIAQHNRSTQRNTSTNHEQTAPRTDAVFDTCFIVIK